MLKPLQSVAIALLLFLSLTGLRPLTPSVGVSSSGPGSGDALTTDPLSQFASTTSNQLAMVINNETGTGFLVFNDSPTIVTPTIASFVNATHSHTNAAGGGQLGESALLLGANTTNDVSITRHGFVPVLPNVATQFLNGVGAWATAGDALTANPLSQFASTTSLQLLGVISNETGTGALVFGTSPTLVTPALGTPSVLVLANATGLPPAGVTGTAAILGANTFTGQQIVSLNGAASTSPLTLTGTIFTGGSATTTKPQLLVEPAGTTSTAWSTAGTGIGVNAPSGFVGNLADFQLVGVSKFKVDSTGRITAGHVLSEANIGVTAIIGITTSGIWHAAFSKGAGGVPLGLALASDATLLWDSGTNALGGGGDLRLVRDAAAILAQRNGTNAQTLRVYGTYTDASNLVNGELSATSTLVTLAARTLGTGADDVSINLDPAGTGTIQVDGTDGVSGTSTALCTNAACTTTCTIIYTKGLRTGGTC